MTERPILFSGPMVRALLDGSKTLTRRAIKPQPENDPRKHHPIVPYHNGQGGWNWVLAATGHGSGDPFPCPYGQPGDRLWVRETFYAWGRWGTRYSSKKRRDEWHFVDMTLECGKAYQYRGDRPQPLAGKRDGGITPKWWKRPAIHMPRAASRLTLGITDVRVERLLDISDGDARAEGIEFFNGDTECGCRNYLDKTEKDWTLSPRDSFRSLWESINGPGAWAANPWVWAVSFKKLP